MNKKISNSDIGIKFPDWMLEIIRRESQLKRHLSRSIWHWSNGRYGYGQIEHLKVLGVKATLSKN